MKSKLLTCIDYAHACVQRVNQGHSKPLNLSQCIEAVAHPLDGLSRVDLVEVIAYLAAQVAGYQNSPDREARLSMAQIRSVVDDYYRRNTSTPDPAPVAGSSDSKETETDA